MTTMKNTQTAVLVIDVQEALSSGRWAMFEADAVIERINGVMARARAAGLPVVIVRHESNDEMLAHGSPGWQLAAALDAQAGDHRVRKTASDSFHKTELHELLQGLGIGELVVGGFQSDFCVDSTVRRALGLGYEIRLLSDGHSTLDNEALSAADISRHHNLTLVNLDSYGPRVRLEASADVRFAAAD